MLYIKFNTCSLTNAYCNLLFWINLLENNKIVVAINIKCVYLLVNQFYNMHIVYKSKPMPIHIDEYEHNSFEYDIGVYFAKKSCKIEDGFMDIFRLQSWNLVFGQSVILLGFNNTRSTNKFCSQKKKAVANFAMAQPSLFFP